MFFLRWWWWWWWWCCCAAAVQGVARHILDIMLHTFVFSLQYTDYWYISSRRNLNSTAVAQTSNKLLLLFLHKKRAAVAAAVLMPC